ncbi:MAG: hypothetical protein AAB036_05390 [Elusimicrobiota bacterium]
MKEINLRFDVTFSPNFIRSAAVLTMLLAAARELGSETVSIATYYPAPSGVYTRIITTGNTVLARDNGSVAIGGAVLPIGQTKLAVLSGRVGIGTSTPEAALTVVGGLQVGALAGPCNALLDGTMRWSFGDLQVCKGGTWSSITTVP